MRPARKHGALWQLEQAARTLALLFVDLLRYVGDCLRTEKSLAAENLFLRKQLALYQERQMGPRRIDPATRIGLVMLSRLCDWRSVLVVVQPATLIRHERQSRSGPRDQVGAGHRWRAFRRPVFR